MEKTEETTRIFIELESMQTGQTMTFHLPIIKEKLASILLKLTGSELGTEYIIRKAEGICFYISPYEDIQILNKVAEIMGRLKPLEQQALIGWYENWEKQELTDFVEIGNAALQINKVEYIPGVESYGQLGKVLLEKSGEQLKTLCIPRVEEMYRYIDLESIGRDYDSREGRHHYPVKIDGRFCGYMLDDSDIDIHRFQKEELLETDVDVLFQKCREQ